MAADPQFASTPLVGSAIVNATLGANLYSATVTNTTTVFTAGASGAKVEEIIMHGNSTTVTVAGMMLVYIVKNTGTVVSIFDVFPVTAVTPSATVAPFRLSRTYDNLLLGPSDLISIVSSVSSQLITCTVLGASL